MMYVVYNFRKCPQLLSMLTAGLRVDSSNTDNGPTTQVCCEILFQ